MFSRKPGEREWRLTLAEQARIIENLQAQEKSLHNQLVAASREAERRITELEQERDEWRYRARAAKYE